MKETSNVDFYPDKDKVNQKTKKITGHSFQIKQRLYDKDIGGDKCIYSKWTRFQSQLDLCNIKMYLNNSIGVFYCL